MELNVKKPKDCVQEVSIQMEVKETLKTVYDKSTNKGTLKKPLEILSKKYAYWEHWKRIKNVMKIYKKFAYNVEEIRILVEVEEHVKTVYNNMYVKNGLRMVCQVENGHGEYLKEVCMQW